MQFAFLRGLYRVSDSGSSRCGVTKLNPKNSLKKPKVFQSHLRDLKRKIENKKYRVKHFVSFIEISYLSEANVKILEFISLSKTNYVIPKNIIEIRK